MLLMMPLGTEVGGEEDGAAGMAPASDRSGGGEPAADQAKAAYSSAEEIGSPFDHEASFIENRDQIPTAGIRYYTPQGDIWFTDDGLWMDIPSDDIEGEGECGDVGGGDGGTGTRGVVLKQEFVDCNPVLPEGGERLGWDSNFFYGADPAGWVTGAPNYAEVWYRDLWDGIDLRYYTNEDGLKYDLIVRPGADPGQIRMRYAGAEGLVVDGEGGLQIHTAVGLVTDGDLFIYQETRAGTRTVAGEILLYDDMAYGFQVSDGYLTDTALVIDPVLKWSTFAGGTLDDHGYGLDVNTTGEVLVTGSTLSVNFPTTPGAYDTAHNGMLDVFVTKLNPDGASLAYSTFIGGGDDDEGYAIAVDDAGNATVTGWTASADFPTTLGSFQTAHGGNDDGFVLQLSANGSLMAYSSYLGGGDNERCNDLTLDPSGNAYVTGSTESTDFPTTLTAIQKVNGGGWDAFISKLDPVGSSLVISTFVGGSGDDLGEGIDIIQVPGNYNALITGMTESTDLPVTNTAYDKVHNGGEDAFAVRLAKNANKLEYCTYLGGGDDDRGYSIHANSADESFITGSTKSTGFPMTSGAYDNTYNGGWDVFISKLDPKGETLPYSTFVGDAGDETGYAVTADSTGIVYVAGETGSANFPVSSDAYSGTYNGGPGDAFILMLDPGTSQLVYSSFLGGSGRERAEDLVLDADADALLTGFTGSAGFPKTPGCYQSSIGGNEDAFALKFGLSSLSVRSLDILRDGVPVTTAYSRLSPYTLRVNVSDTASILDVKTVALNLDPGGTDILLAWDRAASQFSKLNDPDDHIILEPTSNAYNALPNTWTVEFHVIFDWSYPVEALQDVHARATSVLFADAWQNTTGLFSVENDLLFAGNLTVLGEDARTLLDGDLVGGGELIDWSNLTVVYEGTSDVYPPDEEANVTVWDEAGGNWECSPLPGEPFQVGSVAPSVTDTVGITYTINISGIPPANDATDETFVLRIDADNVTFTDHSPDPNVWQTASDVAVGVTVSDTGGGLVNGSSISLAASLDNGTTWGSWLFVPYISAETIDASAIISLQDGDDNLVKWTALDTLGNGYAESLPQRVPVDTAPIFFSDEIPAVGEESYSEVVLVGITMLDNLSGVDASRLDYALSIDGGTTWGDWIGVDGLADGSSVAPSINVTFPNGTGNRIKWRAWDVAGNGPTESKIQQVNVNLPVGQEVSTLLVSPADTATFNENSVELKWATTKSGIAGATFDVYVDTVDPPVSVEGADIAETTLLVPDLLAGQTYHWTVIPRIGSYEGECTSGVWSFTYDPDVQPVEVELLAPADGATLDRDSIQLIWAPVGSGIGWDYDVYVDNSDPPQIIESSGQKEQNITVSGLGEGVVYYWTVVPRNGTIVGSCISDVWSFSYDAGAVIPRVTLLSPLNGDTLFSSEVTLEWEPQGDGTGWTYDVFAGRDAQPSILKAEGIQLTRLTLEDLEDGETYYWTVVPRDAGGLAGVYGEPVWNFTLIIPGETYDFGVALAAPPLVRMVPGISGRTIVNVSNTGMATDRYILGLNGGELEGLVSIRGGQEVTVLEGGTTPIILDISLTKETEPGNYTISLTAISLKADEIGLDIYDTANITVWVTSAIVEPVDVGQKDEGQRSSIILILLIIIVLIVIILIAVLLVLKKKRKAEEDKDTGGPDAAGGPVLKPDIIGTGPKPMSTGPTPAAGAAGGPGGAKSPIPAGVVPGGASPPSAQPMPSGAVGKGMGKNEILRALRSMGSGTAEGGALLALPPARSLGLASRDLVKPAVEGPTTVETIFLLSENSLLIDHFSSKQASDIDPDILSSMLMTITAFVKDSMNTGGALLKQLQVGDMTILLSRGKHVTMAAIVKGPRAEEYRSQVDAAIKDIEKLHGDILEDWGGDSEDALPLDEQMTKLVTGGYN